MNHFDAVLPGAVHHVINERLIEDTEKQVRQLLDHVGVPFDPACLEFHKTKRAVRSPARNRFAGPSIVTEWTTGAASKPGLDR